MDVAWCVDVDVPLWCGVGVPLWRGSCVQADTVGVVWIWCGVDMVAPCVKLLVGAQVGSAAACTL